VVATANPEGAAALINVVRHKQNKKLQVSYAFGLGDSAMSCIRNFLCIAYKTNRHELYLSKDTEDSKDRNF
jgi:hypothetical protein